MLVKFNNDGNEYTVNLDQAYVWVTLEEDLGITVTEAEAKMAEGSTKIITYAIWLAADTETTYKEWLKKLGQFEVVTDYPKVTDPEV